MEENLWINHVRIIREKIGCRVFGLFKIYFLHVLNLTLIIEIRIFWRDRKGISEGENIQ